MPPTRLHNEWLSLIEVSGPFLSVPVLERVLPQGLDAHEPDHVRVLKLAFEEWEDDQNGMNPNPAIHREWVKFVLKQTLELPEEVIVEGQEIPQTLRATMPLEGETLRPDFCIRNPDGGANPNQARLLIQTYPPSQDLDKALPGRHWKASPATRMMELLHATETRVGLVTNGEQWMLVDAPKGETTGFASWFATLWFEEPLTLRAFRTFLGVRRFFSVADEETLEAMLKESASNQQEVTDRLGYQVREAVEEIVRSLDRLDQDEKRALLAGIPETDLYEAALTVMMRLVFLFSAEERGLLLLGDPLYDEHYAVSTLVAKLQEAADQHGEEVLERRHDAWVRLLSTFRAVFGGVQHERMKLLPYAGKLFDPDRFPFLEGRKPGTTWKEHPALPLPIDNRTVLHLLRSLQYLELQGEARRLSFRALDIEQIGHVYEGLLDHTARRASEPMVSLTAAKGDEPEIALAILEEYLQPQSHGDTERKNQDHEKSTIQNNLILLPDSSLCLRASVVPFLMKLTGRSASALTKSLSKPGDLKKLRAACGDEELFTRLRPFSGLVRSDTFDRPVVIRKGSVFVTAGTDRRSSGTHYTPRSLTEPIVRYTLEPLVYVGPAEGLPEGSWTLRSAKELLDLKVCDMACGSGAFLVQADRYLADRLVEAWDIAEKQHPGVPGIIPDGSVSTDATRDQIIPRDDDERRAFARRLVAQRCLYGVDKNPLAAEMAKLSIWLLTLAKDKPFTFLDHAVRWGDSLVGIADADQLMTFSLDRQGTATLGGAIIKRLDALKLMRDQLTRLPENNAADVERKRRMLDNIEDQAKRVTYAADFLLAASWEPARAAERDQRLKDALFHVEHRFKDLDTQTLDAEAAEVRRQAGLPHPFHWPLEFPEVFLRPGLRGFDAFVGNPPFSAVRLFASTLGENYTKSLFTNYPEASGNVDISAFFIRRAFDLLSDSACLGLIVTNSISEGSNRLASLEPITELGRVYRAYCSLRWPGTANVFVSLIYASKKVGMGYAVLNDHTCKNISSSLTDEDELTAPFKMVGLPCQSFRGSDWNGSGFLIEEEFAQKLLQEEVDATDYLLPCLNGREYCDSPTQKADRWIIFFQDKAIDDLKPLVPGLISTLHSRVYEERQASSDSRLKRDWWTFRRSTMPLYEAAWKQKNVFVVAFTSKYVSFCYIHSKQVFANTLNVFVGLSWDGYCVLQSNFHEAWVFRYCSRLKTDIRYAPSDLFETFPFPICVLQDSSPESLLSHAGQEYHTVRQELMNKNVEGLTRTYNRFHNPDETAADIQKLRDLHVEMDRAVAAAYEWSDLALGHGFHQTKQGLRFTISEPARREVLARLLKLNHERHAEELRQGLVGVKAKPKPRATKKKSKPEEGGGLF